MSICETFIQELTSKLPEKCTAKDLVEAGLFGSEQAAYTARKFNVSPPYFKLGGRVVYPKEGVINWLYENKHESSEKTFRNSETTKANGLPQPSRMAHCCRS